MTTLAEPVTSQPQRIPRRHDVDGLRGIAILAVLGYHFFPDVVQGGFVGVDVFFVISGFVITNLLLLQPARTRTEVARFWGRRVRRLFPALALVLATTLVAGWFVLWPAQYAQLGQSTAWSSAMLGNVYAWLQTGYFGAEPTWNPLLNLWSLGVEEQFYIVWPLLLLVTLAVWRRGVVAVIVVLGVGSWLLAVLFVAGRDGADSALSAVFYLPWFRAWEFCVGALVAGLAFRAGGRSAAQPSAAWRTPLYLVLAVGLLVVLVLPPLSLNAAYYAAPAVLATGALIHMGGRGVYPRRLLANQPLLWLGRISYPLYLWHWPILSLGLSAGLALTFGGSVGMIALSVGLAYLTWRVLESPIHRQPITGRLMAALIIPVVAVGCLGYAVGRLGGLPDRGSDVARDLNDFTYDPVAEYRQGECFILDNDGRATALLEACVEAEPGKENILLWGDSYAAHLYRGLAASLTPGQTLTQLNASSCPPEWRTEPASVNSCAAMNELASSLIAQGRFDVIVVGAFWQDGTLEGLRSSIQRVQEATDARVVVVGTPPQWSPSLPRHWSYLEARGMTALPEYAQPTLREERAEVDARVRSIAEDEGVEFFDPMTLLCREDGCLVRSGPDVSTLVQWDSGHFTRAGSLLVGPKLAEVIARPSPGVG